MCATSSAPATSGHTAHDTAAATEDRAQPLEQVQTRLTQRAKAAHARHKAYARGHDAIRDERIERQRFVDEYLSRERGRDDGLKL